MLNLIDIILAVLLLAFLLKNAGGIFKTIRNLLAVVVFLVAFGITAQFILLSILAEPVQKILTDSYFVQLSQNIIRVVYPPLKSSAPKIDSFINEKIMTKPAPNITLPTIPKELNPIKNLPKVSLDDLLKDK